MTDRKHLLSKSPSHLRAQIIADAPSGDKPFLGHLEHDIALHFMHYNFVRIHKSLRITPAMEVRVTDHLWKIEDTPSVFLHTYRDITLI